MKNLIPLTILICKNFTTIVRIQNDSITDYEVPNSRHSRYQTLDYTSENRNEHRHNPINQGAYRGDMAVNGEKVRNLYEKQSMFIYMIGYIATLLQFIVRLRFRLSDH